MNAVIMQLNFYELCQSADLPQTVLLDIVEHGIVEPRGRTPEQWRFDANELAIVKRAFRLQVQLQIDWAGVALALQLLDDIEQLHAENNHLRRRLSRFEEH